MREGRDIIQQENSVRSSTTDFTHNKYKHETYWQRLSYGWGGAHLHELGLDIEGNVPTCKVMRRPS